MGEQKEPIGLQDKVSQLLEEHGEDGFAEALPDGWLDTLIVSGTPQDCAESVQRFIEASADAVVFVPPFDDEKGQIGEFVTFDTCV